MQFSKKICLFAMILTCAVLLGNFVLAWFDKQTLSDVAIAVIGTFGGFVTTGYFTLSGVRDCSINRYGNGNLRVLHKSTKEDDNEH